MRIFAYFCAIFLAMPVWADPARWQSEWPNTDFSQSDIDFADVFEGGPPRAGIPALDGPDMLAVADETRLAPNEPVITVSLEGGPARAYPLRYLTWHEIVNDEVAGLPIAVTFCPLCNSAITFDRRVQGRVLSFGVSGKLRHSDMIMYDRETESWWQQAIGQGIVGEMTGVDLDVIHVSWVESWESFSTRHPDGLVMDQPDFNRPYGRNPYVGYDSSAQPFLYNGENPPHGIEPLARVVRVGTQAWPLSRLSQEGSISEAGVTLDWQGGVASALDAARIPEGRDVGMVRVSDGQGADIAHDVMFAFAFHAFWPEGDWMLGQ